MAQAQYIPTYTIIQAIIPAVDVTTYYKDAQLGDILNVFINEEYQIINASPVQEGYLIVVASSISSTNIDLEIDSNGELMVFGDEAESYEIDANGFLIYTTP